MCRHAGYVGPGATLSELLLEMDHSLEHQAYAPRELLTGVVCADGFGVGWYQDDVRPEPARYADPAPIWSDPSIRSLGPLVRTGMMVAAIRNATVPGHNTAANCAPFADGRYLWSLNGFLEDFDPAWRDVVNGWIPTARRGRIQGNTDGEYLFQAFLARVEEEAPGRGAFAAALQALLRDVRQQAAAVSRPAQLNILASDGKQLVATRCGTGERQNSLYHLFDGEEFPGGHLVASEPLYDDPGWEAVAPDTLLVVQAGAPPVRLKI